MEQRGPERDWSPFAGDRFEADDYESRYSAASNGPRVRRRELRRGRPLLIALIAVLVELIAIGGIDNQWVVKHLIRYSNQHPVSFPGHFVNAATVYQWRFTSQPGDRANEPLAHAVLVLVVVALTWLLVAIVTRGAITFWRAFFGTWMAVIVATLAGMIMRNLISPPPYPPNFSHAAGAVFLAPTGIGVIAGALLGFVCALFAALVAVASRRTLSVGDPAPRYSSADTRAYEPDTYRDADAYQGSGYRTTEAYPETESYRTAQSYGGADAYYGNGLDSASTQRLVRDDDAATESFRAEQPTRSVPAEQPTQSVPAEPDSASSDSSGEQPTQTFPRPPDDDDLGHHPDPHDLPDRNVRR